MDCVPARAQDPRAGRGALVLSDAHTGLKAAIASGFLGAAWRRCRVNFMRNVLAIVPKGNQEMVAAVIRTIPNFGLAQPDAEHVHEQFKVIATMLGKQLPKVEQMVSHDSPLAPLPLVWSVIAGDSRCRRASEQTDPDLDTWGAA